MHTFILVFTIILYMNKDNIEVLNEVALNKHLSKATMRVHKVAVEGYTDYVGKSMKELIDEADDEEEKQIRMKRRKIKKNLQGYQAYLINEKYAPRTVNTMINSVKSIYSYYEIELPSIKQVAPKHVETYNDIPNKKDIRDACNSTNKSKQKALVLFMASSGCARNEALSLTIHDYIEATSEYHHEVTIGNTVNALLRKPNVIPTWRIHRKKTNTPYFTFCTPEATQWITKYLYKRMSKEDLTDDSQLFKYSLNGLTSLFRRLNENIGGRYVDNHCFFHSHALRKFFATTLINADLDSMTIDFLSGRKISSTHEAYFKADPRKLKNKYVRVVDKLTILDSVRVRDISSSERLELEAQREETRKLKEDVKRLSILVDKLPKR